ncbi:MAG TPA: hypothetical protein DDX81_10915 [Desulfofustis sp.]|jgi:peroxiredoxin|nr:hypothetical protein [Desulfofustis sp.]
MGEKHGLSYAIVRDEGNGYAARLGLRFTVPDYLREVYTKFSIDLPRLNGEQSWTLAMPARYVIDRSGRVVAADCDPDYTNRPEPEKTLGDLRAIG